MPLTIMPPSKNASAKALVGVFERAEKKLIAEITRKRAQGYVDYAEVARLKRIREILQEMVDESAGYIPSAVEYEFYKGGKHRAGYRNAEAVSMTEREFAIEQLQDNLLGQVQEMAGTAYQSAVSKLALLGRTESDIFREVGLTQAIESMAVGRGAMTTTEEVIRSLNETGITAFVDKAGREWSLRSYGNMAVRTTVRQAQVSALLTEDDHDLYQVIWHYAPCRLCATYAGRVYSKSGKNPNYPPLAMAFGKIDPAGPNELANSFLNIHPNCLVPGGLVLAEGVVSESRRLYCGKVVTLKTSTGNEITVTPNHPVLTDRGFVAADLLHEGDKIIEASGEYARFFGQTPNNIDIPTAIDEIFHSLVKSGGGSTHCVKSTAEQFHGDGIPDGEVDIVFTDSLGRGVRDALRNKPVTEQDFPTAHLGRVKFLADSPFFKIVNRTLFALNGFMRRLGLVSGIKCDTENLHDLPNGENANTAFFCNLGVCKALFMKVTECFKHFPMFVKVLLGDNAVRFSAAPTLGTDDPSILFGKFNGTGGDAELLRNLSTGESVVDERLKHFTGHNALVVSVLTHKKTSFYNGYVYNFETEHSFYAYNNIVTHNCLCTLSKYTEAGKTEKQIEQMRERSSFDKHPADVDPRSKREIEAYRTKERNRAKLLAEQKQWMRYKEAGVPGVPQTFQTFQKHKRLDDEKYKDWMRGYKKAVRGEKP